MDSLSNDKEDIKTKLVPLNDSAFYSKTDKNISLVKNLNSFTVQ